MTWDVESGIVACMPRESSLPRQLQPMLATLTDAPFDDPDWVFETKWDGFRMVALIEGGSVTLYSRNGKVVDERYRLVATALEKVTRGGHVLKFIGDAMLATLSFEAAEERVACNRGLEAAVESLEKVDSRNQQRQAEGLPLRPTSRSTWAKCCMATSALRTGSTLP
jgi:hypothetical protein